MRPFKSGLFGLGLLLAAGSVSASESSYSAPELLQVPQQEAQTDGYPLSATPTAGRTIGGYTGAPTAYNSGLFYARRQPNELPQPEEQVEGYPKADEPNAAMNGGVYNEHVGCAPADDCTACLPTCCTPWFGSVAGLIMGRNNPNAFWTTYETNNNPNQLMNTKDARSDWAGGMEFKVGRWFCGGCDCSRHGLEFSYFFLDESNGFASIRDVNNLLSTPIDLGNVAIGADTAADFFDNSREHRIWRSNEVHNLEINLLHQPMYHGAHGSQLTFIAGARYFKFDEGLIFGAVSSGNEFGSAGGVNEAYLEVNTENNLVGFQVGAQCDHYFTPCFSLYATPKLGIYGNNMNATSRLYRGDGLEVFNIDGQKSDFSMLGQLDFGMNYLIGPNTRLYGGYRALAVSGIALSDEQIPPFLADAAGFATLESNADLILHGAFAGVEVRF